MNRRGTRLAGCIFLFSGGVLSAGYSNLVATSDGSAVYFEARTGFLSTRWYQVRLEADVPVVRELPRPLADVSADGSTVASSYYGEKYCGVAGSTCWLAAPCSAGFSVEGPAGKYESSGRRTFIRLGRDGRRAWIEQSGECRGMGFPVGPEYQGLYELPGLRPLAAAGGARLANTRPGRRVITNRDQVLTLGAGGIQLQILDAAGARPIRHQFGAAEAVIDAGDRSLAYTEALLRRLRWIDLASQTDEDLAASPVFGNAPALSDDGRLLAFLTLEGRLNLYRRETRAIQPLETGQARLLEFVLSGDGRFIFAVTEANRLLRLEVSSGKAETWLDPAPEVRETSAPLGVNPSACPLVCYGSSEPSVILGRTALVVLRGDYWDQPGWRVRLGDDEWPLQPLSSKAAWFQVPRLVAGTGFQRLVVFNPDHPIRFTITAQVRDRIVSCFGALHQNFDRIVSAQDPACAGEYIHIFLTGLEGVEPVPEGIPNPLDRLIPVASPPELGGDGALEPWFFGLAPGLIGLQQLDVRVARPVPVGTDPTPRLLFLNLGPTSGCHIPPTAQ